MDFILPLVGILILAFVISKLIQLSYSFLFFIAKMPWLWIVFVTALPVAVWAGAAVMGWRVSVPAWASVLGLFQSQMSNFLSKELQGEFRAAVDELYIETGLRRGRLLHRVGLIGFVIAMIGSWVVFYGEYCSSTGCTKLIDRLFP